MNYQFIKNTVIATAAIVSFGLTGCVKNPGGVNGGDGESNTANSFSFSTKKQVEFTLKYDVPTGYRVNFEMYSSSPLSLDTFKSYVKDSTLIPFLSGRADENGQVHFKGELPTTTAEIYAYSTAIGVPTLMRASVSDNGAVSNFQVATISSANEKMVRANGNGVSGTNYWKTYSVSINNPTLPVVSMSISKEDKNLIDLSFPENQNYDIVRSYYRPSIQLNKKATLKIYSVKHGANSDRTNALAYFVYTDDTNVKPEDINSNLQMAFPELNKKVPTEGSGVQLMNGSEQVFEAGSHIGFALFPDITPGKIETQNTHVLYSYFNHGTWNSYSYPGVNGETGLIRANVPHMVISLLRVSDDGHAIIAIAFEDQPFSYSFGTNKGNFRDDIFIVEVDPASSLPDLPEPPTEEPDYDTEYKSSGILSFEDCWPHAGDYDINDVTISYERSALISYSKGLVGLKENFTFLNNGATFSNGFGYQLLGLNQSDIKKSTVKSSTYDWDKQGLDATANEAIVMLFEDGKTVKPGTQFEVLTTFNEGAVFVGVNPFIAVKKNSSEDIMAKDRVEVHLPTTTKVFGQTFYPTSKAALGQFGQYEDKSDLKNKIYYVRSGNYPFALDINWDNSKYGEPTNFVIPKETKNIDYTYPQFKGWVESNGKNNKEWFLNPSKNI